MKKFIFYIENKNYSSWSFRGWLAVKFSGIEFDEIRIPLYIDDHSEKIKKISSSGKIPCLHHGDLIVWDSLAIIEYLNELFPNKNLYPKDIKLRSIARSCIAEMHSSFLKLRAECTMNMRRKKSVNLSNDAIKDLKRIYEIFDYCKKHSGSDSFLLGDFCAIDIFFAPIISRIISYELDQENHSEYISRVSNHELFKEWKKEALEEIEIIKRYEID